MSTRHSISGFSLFFFSHVWCVRFLCWSSTFLPFPSLCYSCLWFGCGFFSTLELLSSISRFFSSPNVSPLSAPVFDGSLFSHPIPHGRPVFFFPRAVSDDLSFELWGLHSPLAMRSRRRTVNSTRVSHKPSISHTHPYQITFGYKLADDIRIPLETPSSKFQSAIWGFCCVRFLVVEGGGVAKANRMRLEP